MFLQKSSHCAFPLLASQFFLSMQSNMLKYISQANDTKKMDDANFCKTLVKRSTNVASPFAESSKKRGFLSYLIEKLAKLKNFE